MSGETNVTENETYKTEVPVPGDTDLHPVDENDTSNVADPSDDEYSQDPDQPLATTPNYNQPEDADRYPVAIPNPLPAHTVFKGDPRVDGPYLDDYREAQDDARRRQGHVHAATVAIQKKKQEEGIELRENLKKAADLNPAFATPVEPDENDIATGVDASLDSPTIGDSGLEVGSNADTGAVAGSSDADADNDKEDWED
jgi:hypothetical protein